MRFYKINIKTFEAPQLIERKTIRLFGLFREFEYIKNNNHARTIELLNGLFSYRDESNSWKICFLGIPLFGVKRRRKTTIRVLGIPLLFFDRSKEFYSEFVACLNSAELNSPHVIVIRHNIGESLCYFGQYRNWLKTNHLEGSTLIVWREKDISLLKLFDNQVDTCGLVKIPQCDINSFFKSDVLKIDKYTIHCPTFRIAEEMRSTSLRGIEVNFYDFILNSMGLDRSFAFDKPIAPKEAIEKAANFLQENGVDNNNFVLICPESTSLVDVDKNFWHKLIKTLQAKGYTVLINNIYTRISESSCIHCSLPLDQLYAIGMQSQGIITLASGLGVLMALTGRNVDLIYTDFKSKSIGYSADLTKSIYSVFHLPNLNGDIVSEWIYEPSSIQQLINQISSKYKQVNNV